MDVSFLVARLQGQLAGAGLKAIGSSADLDTAIAGALATPSVYVIPMGESAEPSALLSETVQRETHEFGVISVVANRRDVSGKASLDDLVPIRAAIKAALVGWAPYVETGEAMLFRSGRLLRFEEGRIWWTDLFAVRTYYHAPY